MVKSASTKSTDHPLERLVFFSDAVFAIAITLLVIEIEIPHLSFGDDNAAWAALAHLTPSFFGFVLSFLVIGRFWIGHHNAFSMIDHYDGRLAWPNMLLLMCIALMPFGTAFMAANIGQFVPTLFYNGMLLVTAICSRVVIGMATGPALVSANADKAVISMLRARGFGVILGSLTAVFFTFWSPGYSQIALITIPLWQRIIGAASAPPSSKT